MQAALDGSKEIAFTIISMTVSLAAVFIPILFMGGIVGRLMHEFAVTIGAAILVSGLVSLTLTPMLCSRFLKPLHSMNHGWFYNATEKMFDVWLKGYAWTLRQTHPLQGARPWSCRRCCSSAPSTSSGSCRKASSRASTPGQINGGVEFAQGVGYETTVVRMRQLMDILPNDPNVAAFTGRLGRRPPEHRPEAARASASASRPT